MYNYILTKLSKSKRMERVYILPTLDGIKLLTINLVLLVIGLSYANNYVLLFNFILFGLFLCSMFYTHFNLEGIHLEAVRLAPTHAGETNTMQFFFKTSSKLGHNFIKIKMQSRLIETDDFAFSFHGTNDNLHEINFKIKAQARGVEVIHQIYLETLFPFHLFRCISFHPCNLEVIVYPSINSAKLFLEKPAGIDQSDEIEEIALHPFQHGEPFSRVDWKRVAQTDKWFSKKFIAPKLFPITLALHEDPKGQEKIEDQLSSIATYIRAYHASGRPYGLTLAHRNKKISSVVPDHSPFHLQHCLKVLAMYEH